MRLLFDQNLSPKLVERLSDIFPGSIHVSRVGLDRAADEEVFSYASRHGYAIVSKDADFADMGQVRESAPKVIWLRLGNRTTPEIEMALRSRLPAIETLGGDPDARVLMLS